jgi:hypothetical protein
MRWFVGFLVLLVVATAVYLGTAVTSFQGLVTDTRSGDTAAIMSWIDLPRLRASLTDQIVRAHFGRIEQTRPVKTIERIAAPTVVDAFLVKLLTPENITKVLRSGALPVDGANPQTITLPSLDTAGLENLGRLLPRLRPKSPVQLQVLLDEMGETAIRLHYEGTHWKLSGLDLPPAALDRLTASLPAR